LPPWPNAPHRTPRNKIIDEWEAAGRPAVGKRPGDGTTIGKVVRGDYAPLWAGESCGLVHDIKPAAEIVRSLVREAEEAMSALDVTR
jgi:nitronate monooxygenase